MSKKIFLPVMIFLFIINLSLYDTSLAQSSFYNKLTCSWFSRNCSENNQEDNFNSNYNNNYSQNNNLENSNINTKYTAPSFNPVDFTGIFNVNTWNNWVFGQNEKLENNTVQVNNGNNNLKSQNPNDIIKASDLGVDLNKKSISDSLSDVMTSKLLTSSEISDKKKQFEYSKNEIVDDRSSLLRDDSFDNTNFTPQEQAKVDNLSGNASPHYDRDEPNSKTQGPPLTGPSDEKINEDTKKLNTKDTFVNPGSGSCSNYGMSVGGSCPDTESYRSSFKYATARFCVLTGKKVVITSGNRSPSCNARVGGASGSSHMSGLAMDTAFSGLSENEKTIAVLYFLAQGFNNVGGYNAAGAIHMDLRNGVNRWGPNYSFTSCRSNLFPSYARVAFSTIGVSPCTRDGSVPSKAKSALIKMGKDEFAKSVTGK